MVASQSQNPIEQIQARFKELENGFKLWLSKQSLPVEAAVVTTTSAAQGAAIGAFMGTLTADAPSAFPTPPPNASLNPQAMASLKQAQVLFSTLHFLSLVIVTIIAIRLILIDILRWKIL